MGLAVFWTEFAEKKLEDIYLYYSSKASVSVAKKLVTGIIDKTIDLENSPNIGQREPLLENKPQVFRYLVFKNYKIIYWVNEIQKRIEIANVFDTRQNPVKITKTK